MNVQIRTRMSRDDDGLIVILTDLTEHGLLTRVRDALEAPELDLTEEIRACEGRLRRAASGVQLGGCPAWAAWSHS